MTIGPLSARMLGVFELAFRCRSYFRRRKLTLPAPVISSADVLDDEEIGRHHAVLRMQRGDAAVDHRRLVATDQH